MPSRTTKKIRSTTRRVKPGGKRTTRKGKLTKAQLAQRRYASRMRGVRARASRAPGGRGPVGIRNAAKTLRRKLGIKG